MTTLVEQVFSAISTAGTLAGTSVYPDIGPDTPTQPFVIFSRLPSAPENIFFGPPPIENTKVQVDCYHTDKLASITLRTQVQAALQSASFKAILVLEHDVFEPLVKMYRVSMEFSIWSQ
jgi:hypothetical protein